MRFYAACAWTCKCSVWRSSQSPWNNVQWVEDNFVVAAAHSSLMKSPRKKLLSRQKTLYCQKFLKCQQGCSPWKNLWILQGYFPLFSFVPYLLSSGIWATKWINTVQTCVLMENESYSLMYPRSLFWEQLTSFRSWVFCAELALREPALCSVPSRCFCSQLAQCLTRTVGPEEEKEGRASSLLLSFHAILRLGEDVFPEILGYLSGV